MHEYFYFNSCIRGFFLSEAKNVLNLSCKNNIKIILLKTSKIKNISQKTVLGNI